MTLGTLDELFKFLARPEHVFVMAGSEELPSIDQYAKQHTAHYFVVDDTSARYIMLSNRLASRRARPEPAASLYVSDKPPTPAHPLSINFDNKVELIGWDAPAVIGAHQDFKLRLYFKVNAPLPGSYKVFVHIDGAGTRINGDHVPLDGKFPTNYWVVGSYITDEHTIHPSDNNTGAAPNSGYLPDLHGHVPRLRAPQGRQRAVGRRQPRPPGRHHRQVRAGGARKRVAHGPEGPQSAVLRGPPAKMPGDLRRTASLNRFLHCAFSLWCWGSALVCPQKEDGFWRATRTWTEGPRRGGNAETD